MPCRLWGSQEGAPPYSEGLSWNLDASMAPITVTKESPSREVCSAHSNRAEKGLQSGPLRQFKPAPQGPGSREGRMRAGGDVAPAGQAERWERK